MSEAIRTILILVLMMIAPPLAAAHEVKPAYLDIEQTYEAEFKIVWKQPVTDGKRLRLEPVFPEACQASALEISQTSQTYIERYQLACDLQSGTLRIAGLERTLTDVFIRLKRSGEPSIHAVLRPSDRTFELGSGGDDGHRDFLRFGVEHILLGYDHLLFVIGLVLITRARHLPLTVTAFTLAHSLTLAGSVLTNADIPQTPVEIIIAMSLVFLAREALEHLQDRRRPQSLKPWFVAFLFGLIHGLGFAGALRETGLPQDERGLALLYFNIGVEIGQLAFVLVLLIIGAILARLLPRLFRHVQTGGAYLIGVAGAAWMIQRLFNIA